MMQDKVRRKVEELTGDGKYLQHCDVRECDFLQNMRRLMKRDWTPSPAQVSWLEKIYDRASGPGGW